jgi:hypothetical protein
MYGQWLSALGADKDSITQLQLRTHDWRLLGALDYELRKEGKGLKVRDLIKRSFDNNGN